jgi:replicative DNA helicase
LDKKTSGLQNSDLIIVAGRPSMGKTSFAMNIVENIALIEKKPVAVFSMEMPGEQLLIRMLASLSKINIQKIRNANLQEEDWHRLVSSTNILSKAPIFIDDSPALSPIEVRARVRRLKREQGELGLIVIDYIQLMQSGKNTENKASEMSEISRNLKAIAKEMNVPVVALSQLNRAVEQRADKHPVMSDLRDSGAIEQDADLILFVYRDEIYNKDTPDQGIAEIIISKQRNGPIGSTKLVFLGEYTKFENLAEEMYDSID